MKEKTFDKIHFLNTGHSDCILLESDGHFALVDAAEDTEYPLDKPNLNLPGYEDVVIDYLLSHCADESGNVYLDFVLGTHAHSDHIGGFDSVILHPQIHVKQAYLRKYTADNVNIMERTRWDNQEVYDQMIHALKETNTPLSQDFNGKSFKMGNFNITFMHGKNKRHLIKYGENTNSVVTLVEKNGTKILLAGDMNHRLDDEKRVAKTVGKVHLLKAGHHGYPGSNGIRYIKKISPDFTIFTNYRKNIFKHIVFIIEKIGHSKLLTTVEENGIIADIYGEGKIVFHRNIMDKRN